MRRQKNRFKNLFIKILIFLAVFACCFLGFQFFTKTGLFHVPGVVYYDRELSEEEISLLKGIFTEDLVLDKDVHISVKEYFEKPNLKIGDYLYQIYVPVTDFYSENTNLDIDNPSNLFADPYIKDYEIISINDLNFDKKLLSLNNKYYLDDFESGAVFKVISFESEKFKEEIEPLVKSSFDKSFPDKSSVLTFAQTGVTALSRGMNKKLNQIRPNCFLPFLPFFNKFTFNIGKQCVDFLLHSFIQGCIRHHSVITENSIAKSRTFLISKFTFEPILC
jgi:hypothetical protein